MKMKRKILCIGTSLFMLANCDYFKVSHQSTSIFSENRDRLLSLHEEKAPSPQCRAFYQELLGEKQILEIFINFGYKDARPARFVGDRFERTALVQHLLEPCKDSYQACGFKRHSDDGDQLSRLMRGPNQQPLLVKLTITHSSVSSDDKENRRNPFQRWQSHYAQQVYQTALRRAEVVYYVGHSRDGGGPDFFPPKLREGQHIDMEHYRTNQSGLKLTLAELKEASQRGSAPDILGLFSCVSDDHFSKMVLAAAPQTSLITSPVLLYYSDALESVAGSLHALLSFDCEKQFARAVSTTRANNGSQLENFFNKKTSRLSEKSR